MSGDDGKDIGVSFNFGLYPDLCIDSGAFVASQKGNAASGTSFSGAHP
jgi:hypothetical protein